MRLYVFGSAVAKRVIVPVLYERKLPRVEHHAHVRIRKVEFLVSTAPPHDLAYLLGLEISDEKCLRSIRHHEPVLQHVDPRDFRRNQCFDDHSIAGGQGLYHNLRGRDVVELELPFVPYFS